MRDEETELFYLQAQYTAQEEEIKHLFHPHPTIHKGNARDQH